MRIHDKPEIMHGFMHCMKECGLIPRFNLFHEVLIFYSLARFKSKELVLAQKFYLQQNFACLSSQNTFKLIVPGLNNVDGAVGLHVSCLCPHPGLRQPF
jgi:hypothetical protein